MLAQPTGTMEPTLQCYLLIGKPVFEASRTVNTAPSCTLNPLGLEEKLGHHNCFIWGPSGGLRFGENSDTHSGAVDDAVLQACDVVSLGECFLTLRGITAVQEGSEDDGIVILWNIRDYSTNDTASHSGTLEYSVASLRGFEVSQIWRKLI